jgi:hypothetical protein
MGTTMIDADIMHAEGLNFLTEVKEPQSHPNCVKALAQSDSRRQWNMQT